MTVIGSTCTCAIICNASFYTLKHWRIICNLNHVKLLQPFFTTYTINTRLYTQLNHVQGQTFSIKSNLACLALKPPVSGNKGAGRGEVVRSFRESTKPYRAADSAVSWISWTLKKPWGWHLQMLPCFFLGGKITEKKGRELFVLKNGFVVSSAQGGFFMVFHKHRTVQSHQEILKAKPVVLLQFA